MLLVGCWNLCVRYAYYVFILMFCRPEEHSGYSDLLWASLGCGIYYPPLSSAEVKESVQLYLYSPLNACYRVKFILYFLSVWGEGSMVSLATVPLAGWSQVQILVGSKDFSFLQNVQTSPGAHSAFYTRVQGFFPSIKVART
jgi:hypothetical protein